MGQKEKIMNGDQIKQDVTGRWNGVFASLGIEVGDGKHCPCPICGGKDRFRYDNLENKGTWFCNNCKPGDGWALVQQVLDITFPEALETVAGLIGSIEKTNIPKESKITPEILRKLFVESASLNGKDLASQYLKNRGLSSTPSCLRYSKSCWDGETKRNQKAMLAVFHNPDDMAVTIHRTYLDEEGGKLDIESPKKIMPPLKKMTGGAVRLYEHDGILGIAEGVETAIAAHEDTNTPVWAALSTTLMEAFEPPQAVKKLIIFADNDKNFAGQKAAYALANKVSIKRDIEVAVYVPEKPGDDWLDVYLKGKKARI
jgi:putative DNA primase/helicase